MDSGTSVLEPHGGANAMAMVVVNESRVTCDAYSMQQLLIVVDAPYVFDSIPMMMESHGSLVVEDNEQMQSTTIHHHHQRSSKRKL